MGLLRFIARGFISFFGITQPSPEQERQAAWFISGLLVLIVLGAAVVFGVVVLGFGR
jgi:Mg2+ and Co2+ transporter CorA